MPRAADSALTSSAPSWITPDSARPATNANSRSFSAAIALVALLLCAAPALAQTASVTLSPAWAPATITANQAGAVYVTIANKGAKADRLTGAATPVAQAATLHDTAYADNIARMFMVAYIEVPPGETAALEPGGIHIMLTGMTAPLKVGQKFPLTLKFRDAGDITVEVEVKPLGHDSLMPPHFDFEREANCVVAGVDEAGRGPLAGPVVAAAVILPADRALVPAGIDDSKMLTALQREALYPLIYAVAQVGVGVASVKEIDRWNILRASLLAMRRALQELPTLPALALIDGNQLPRRLPCAARAIVDGDALSTSIAAASIIAKVHRDRLMDRLARRHRGYGWEHNRGYASAEHRAALQTLGVTKHHRRSFYSVRLALGLEPELPLEAPAQPLAESA